jgi:hypothetical protein
MSIINRRNAVLGYFAWQGAKLVAKQKAKRAVPGVDSGRPNKAAIVAAAAAVAGGVMFWRWWQENGNRTPDVPSGAPEPPTEAK